MWIEERAKSCNWRRSLDSSWGDTPTDAIGTTCSIAPAIQPTPPASAIPVIQSAPIAQPQADVLSQLFLTLMSMQQILQQLVQKLGSTYSSPNSSYCSGTICRWACPWRIGSRNDSKHWQLISCVAHSSMVEEPTISSMASMARASIGIRT